MTTAPLVPVPALPDFGPRGQAALIVAAAVDGVPAVRRTGGTGIEVATQYPGGRVVGVRLSEAQVEIHIVAESPAIAVATQQVHAAARRALDGRGDRRSVAVIVADLDLSSLQGTAP